MRICLLSVSDLPEDKIDLPFGAYERARMEGIRHAERKKESLCALLALRELWGNEPMTIERTPEGKPYFDRPSAPAFSLAHIKNWAAAALGDGSSGSVGIDLELLRPYPQAEDVAKRFFTAEEYAEFSFEGKTDLAFFRVWTKKEALAKMTGNGLLTPNRSRPAYSVSFSLASKNETIIVSLCCEYPIQTVTWQSPSEKFHHFHIEELR